MRKLSIVIAITAIMSSCRDKSEMGPAVQIFDLNEVRSYIDSMNTTYGQRFTSNDTNFYKERYCVDAVIMPEQMPQIQGRDSIRHFNYNDGAHEDFKIAITATNVYGGPAAVIEEGYYTFPGDDGKIYDKGKFIAIWKQEDGKWKLFREIWSTDNAPMTK